MKKVPSVSAMGALISRWKTKRTKVEELENLEKEINKLEEFRTKNQRLQKLWGVVHQEAVAFPVF